MKMRKIIAVLAAAMLLCAAIPMAALSVSAAPGDVIISKNFDDGSVFSNASAENGYMVFNATTADWANVYLYANAIKNATKYEITFDCKANKATTINVKINNNWAGDTFKWTTNVTTEWETYSCVITSNELKELTSTALLMFTSNTTAANGAIYHIDNVVVKEYKDPATIGKITNGDFETGNLSGWTSHQSTTISTNAHTGSYAANVKGNGGWGGMLNQDVSVEAGKTYSVSLWLKANSNGVNVQIKDGGTSGNNMASTWFTKTEWTNVTWEVTPTTDIICFNFCGGGNGVAEDVLVDDIVVLELKDPSFDGYITNGDFEIGKAASWTNLWGSSTVEMVAGNNSEYAIKGTASGSYNIVYQEVAVTPNTDYVIMANSKDSSSSALWIKNAGGNGDIINKSFNSGSTWAPTSVTFNSGSNSTIWVGLMGITAGATYTVDDIFMFEKKAASNDGYIVNGDFETGTTEGLSPSQQTTVSRDAAKDGNFGLQMMGNGGWGGVGLWTITGLEAGATYKFEMDMKAVEQGFNWTLWQDSTSSGVKYASGYFSTKEWTTIEKEFVANSSTAVLNINGGGNGNAETVYLDNLKITLVKPAHTCEFVGVETKAPSCTEDGVMTYSCTCGEGTYTETIPALGHTAGAAADCENAQVCTVCGAELAAALGHSYESAETKAPTCGEAGVMTYTCACGDSYTEEIAATGEHEYFSDCDTVCMNCYQETREASHNVIHADAVAPTCNAMGNIEYWYCDVCGMAWLDEACTLNTNRFAVILPMAEEHTYTNEYDIDCNVCGAERSVVAPVIDVKLSISEDVNGLAFRFEANVAGFAVKAGTFVQADYTNATYNGYKLIETGAIASNGASSTTIKGERMCDLDENGKALFAYRIINIPADKLETEITMQPYYIVEIDGEIVTIYGEVQVGAYAEVAIG